MYKQVGMTIVALVITIVVLLILAGVSISIALDQNGVVTRAEKIRQDNQRQQELQNIKFTKCRVGFGDNTEEYTIQFYNKVDEDHYLIIDTDNRVFLIPINSTIFYND